MLKEAPVRKPGSALSEAIANHVRYSLAEIPATMDDRDWFNATALAVRDRVVDAMLDSDARYRERGAKRVYYLSMEFLMGRSLASNLRNIGLYERCREALAEFGVDMDVIEDAEPDAALGNGGLGRLAACFLDSFATLGIPGFGYGINYEYGLFRQEIRGGAQKENPDAWRAAGSPWLIERPEHARVVPIYGRIDHTTDRAGGYNPMWVDWRTVVGIPFDMPIVGYGGKTVNYLRLFSAQASKEFDMEIFNSGDYFKAVEQKMTSETISKVLYPSDSVVHGKELRLIQEYFLVSCALRDIIQYFASEFSSFDELPQKVAIQLNDTHPALAIAELMRILVDEQEMLWERAFDITVAVCGYTNHTLLPEALERFPVPMLEKVIPRHLQIIFEINRRFLEKVAVVFPGDTSRVARMSIIEESEPKQVRMAHLAIVGSHSVNGVAALHSELVKSHLVRDFYELWPDRFNNKTNGVTQRRWLLASNPGLANLINRSIGEKWICHLDDLRRLETYAGDDGFQQQFLGIKRKNKERMVERIRFSTGVSVDPDALFDVQVKRIHEYKRQLLNAMHVIHCYLEAVDEGKAPTVARTWIFAGKAAPGYWAAKQIILLINNIARQVNRDPKVNGFMRVAFVPDYRVTLAEAIIPSADLSEQISTAGMEASGTGNMKFALNGAMTIGTLDGANIEIREEVGEENFFLFGLKAHEIDRMRREGTYRPREFYEKSANVRRVMDAIHEGRFCPEDTGRFRWIFDSLVNGRDYYFHLADFDDYVRAHEEAATLFRNRSEWARKAILNVARIGKFSSDRTILEYCRDIWGAEPIL